MLNYNSLFMHSLTLTPGDYLSEISTSNALGLIYLKMSQQLCFKSHSQGPDDAVEASLPFDEYEIFHEWLYGPLE